MLMPIMKNLCNRIGSEARRRHELKNTGKAIQVNDVNGLLHTIWNCEGTRNIEVGTRNIKLTTLDKGRQRLILARRKRDK